VSILSVERDLLHSSVIETTFLHLPTHNSIITSYESRVCVYIYVSTFSTYNKDAFFLTDLVLTFTWGAVAVAGLVFQLWREKNRPPFPPTPGPWTWPTRRRLITQSDESVVVPIPTENSPLLTTVQT